MKAANNGFSIPTAASPMPTLSTASVPAKLNQMMWRQRRSVHQALVGSVVVTLLALLVFGYVKGRFTTARPFRSAWQTAVVGGLAATAAFVIAMAIG